MNDRVDADAATRPELSVLFPVFNEEGNLEPLCQQLFSTLRAMGVRFELIAINDGSTDGSYAKLRQLASQNPELKVINFARNHGQTAAVMAGIDYAEGDILVSLDADLQNDPTEIPRLVEKLNEGFDVVSGWRIERKDHRITRNLVSQVANRLISWISGIHLHDYGCMLKAYRRHIIKGVRLYGEMHRFIPIYATWMGARVTEIPVRHHPRLHGESKYGLDRIFKVLLDLIVVMFLERYFTKPIYVFGGFGILSLATSAASGLYMFYLKLIEGVSLISTPLPLLTIMMLAIGVISLFLGLIAEMLVRTYFESQQRQPYLIRDVINIARPR